MHGDTTELFSDHLAFSGVNARSDTNAELLDRVHNCSSAADRTRRAIKRRQEAVPGSIDLATSMSRELVTNKGVMLSEKVLPTSITEFDKPIRRLDNVREQYGGEHAVTVGFDVAALAGQEGFNLSED